MGAETRLLSPSFIRIWSEGKSNLSNLASRRGGTFKGRQNSNPKSRVEEASLALWTGPRFSRFYDIYEEILRGYTRQRSTQLNAQQFPQVATSLWPEASRERHFCLLWCLRIAGDAGAARASVP